MPSRDSLQNKPYPHGIPWGLSFALPGCHLKRKTPLRASLGCFFSRGINTIERQQNASMGFPWLPGGAFVFVLTSSKVKQILGKIWILSFWPYFSRKNWPLFYHVGSRKEHKPAPKSRKSCESPDSRKKSAPHSREADSRKSCVTRPEVRHTSIRSA